MIPKKIHFYWGAKTMPYLRFLSLLSFYKFHPDWEIILYIPTIISDSVSWDTHEQKYDVNDKENWFGKLHTIPNIVIKTIDFTDYGYSNDLPEVIKSDILRWILLYDEGGFWSDMDILYIGGIPDNFLSNDDIICYLPNRKNDVFYSIGFLASKGGTDLFKELSEKTLDNLLLSNYQGCGVMLWYNLFGKKGGSIEKKFSDSKILNLSMDVVYPITNCHQLTGLLDNVKDEITRRTIGLHWYGGHPILAPNVNKTKDDYQRNPYNIIDYYVRMIENI